MLIDTSVTIAYKCYSCGSFDFLDISCFELFCKKNYSSVCRCGNSGIYINEEENGYKFKIGCIGCGDVHTFALSRKNMICKDINILSCPVTGIHQCFIGKGDVVRRTIDGLEKEMDALIDMLGYESYFLNTRVMYDSLNKIHDIAERGDLVCECGNNDIELKLLPDSIHIVCKRCNAGKVVKAASNGDLKLLLSLDQITLAGNENYEYANTDTYLLKSDGNI